MLVKVVSSTSMFEYKNTSLFLEKMPSVLNWDQVLISILSCLLSESCLGLGNAVNTKIS